LIPLSSVPTQIRGLRSYFGTIELSSASDGIVVVNVLPLERYLLGLNEVPLDWPMEALKAQAIAARTYALWTLGNDRSGAAEVYGFDICASDECQVFSGADVLRTPDGRRWRDAVRATSGTAVLFEGEPILARYHSTSGGETFANADVFEGSANLPYLRGVPSPDETGSPFFHWTVRFRLDVLGEMLASAGYGDLGPLVAVRTVASTAGRHDPAVELRGRGGTRVVSASALRDIVRDEAPRLRPRRYPSLAPDGITRLPETLPSDRFEVETFGGTVEVNGRGWGHAVGMSQWGAQGMARDGSEHRAILAHYYPGTSLGDVATDRSVEVGVAWGREEVRAFGAFRVADGLGNTVVERAIGTWTFGSDGTGALSVEAPRSFGRAAHVALQRPPARVPVGDTIALRLRLSAPARLTTSTTGPGPDRMSMVVRDRGQTRLRWRAPERPGRYRIVVRATGASSADASKVHEVAVVGEAQAPGAAGERSLWETVLVGAAAVALVAAIVVGAASFATTISGRWRI
jgi:stage II sporulation protein D